MTNLTITSPVRIVNPLSHTAFDSYTLSTQTNVQTPSAAVALVNNADISAIPQRTMAYRAWRTRVATALLDYGGLDYEAFLFYECSERPLSWIKTKTETLSAAAATVWLCSEDIRHDAALFMPTCDLRICPDCAARATARLAARYIPKAVELALSGGAHHLRHIVFTTPISLTGNTPEKVQADVIRYSNLPRKAMEIVQALGVEHGRDWSTEGAIQSFEFGTEGLKLHFHVIQYGAYLPQDALSDAWKAVTDNEASVVYIRAIDTTSPESVQSDVIETLKYSVKFWSIDKETNEHVYLEPNVMPHLLRVLKGARRVKSWGCFYKLPKPKKRVLECEICNAEMVRIGTTKWHLVQKALESGKSFKQVAFEDSFLQFKLANKSKKSHLYESHSPPDDGEKYRQKDMWKPVSHSHYHYEDNL